MKTTLFITALFVAASIQTIRAQFTKLLDFTNYITVINNGAYPYGSLLSDGTFLYGMTHEGGSTGMGLIFKIKPDGSGYTKLLEFAGAANGANPQSSLIAVDTFLYGMTYKGGTFNKGTVFKIKPDGGGFMKLLDFTGFTNGGYPYGSLTYDGTFLYGMTPYGGTNDYGTIFKIMPDGSGYSKIFDFADTLNGVNPFATLIYDGTFFYGTTSAGGINNKGTLFKIMPNGSSYAKLLDLDGTNGRLPTGSLLSDGTFLYGLTRNGGTNDKGTIFKIKPDGSGYVRMWDFAGANGSMPFGTLISDGTFLYGMTHVGGIYNYGTIFKIMHDGYGFEKMYDFRGSGDGAWPWDALVLEGTSLYGMVQIGGNYNFGTLFKFQPFISISGVVTSETGIPIPAAEMRLGGDKEDSTSTDANGTYSFNVEPGGSYVVSLSKDNDSITNNGNTSIDILLMRKHILGIGALPSPYKIIAAAEVNADGDTTITTQDILFTRSLILGNITSFPTNRLWQFVSSDYVFPDTQHPFPFDKTRTYTNITSNQTNQNFIGIKLGDVNGSWDAGVP